ncbi:GNAT family N-acetyltransferase [Pseudoalteromonas sp. L23]|uniref:GNAT family N-acetyltransferase n=1 Tax=Pseudoalteromonas TaxID=53246 RepID=UPI001EF0CA72|nr:MULTISPECIES: GNAT family N-acetyltransferase [Pseudoalteromonas]MCF7513806.1 GNAT family N-acetyltransferase [Pseudoalteromonas sp. L7]MCF7525846.1 GNAT family N-acetyltransferase [Pseudoalteromonas sp. L23]MCX2766823.1 GNAT family N-acetyltransferase [Pseudoalteromonas sp. B530]MDP4490361.1 GNAT family N-acetyltransferase [Pseudoalteromonas piscicida]
MSRLQFLKVNSDVAGDMLKLKVRDSQQHLIASNAEWIIEDSFNEDSVCFGMYDDDLPVGMIALIDPRLVGDDNGHFQAQHLYIWRLMIDEASQSKGYGKAAMCFAKQYAELIGLVGLSLTTMDTEAENALNFYQALGFIPTGRRLDGEIELIYTQK